jgi:hypothetical protein
MEKYERLDDLICAGRPPFWDESLPWDARRERILAVRKEVEHEYNEALTDDIGTIDTGVLFGALNLMDGLVLGRPGRLAKLVSEPLWDPRLPEKERLEAIQRFRDDVADRWQEHVDDDDASWLDTGILLGVLNLVNDLLRNMGVEVPEDQ